MVSSFLKKIQEKLIPISANTPAQAVAQTPSVKRDFINFETSYRIGLLCIHTDEKVVLEYKKKLEKFGFECDVLMYVDSPTKMHGFDLPTYDFEDLDKKSLLPNSPRTDRFSMKRFDLLINLYFTPYPQLVHISHMSHAKCRIGPYMDTIKDFVDVMIPMDNITSISAFIESMNAILKLKPHERKLD